jgi:hypothetical protein
MKLHLTFCLSIAAALLAGCGGGGGGGGGGSDDAPSTSTAPNVQAIVVDSGPMVNGRPMGTVNTPYVTVTVCLPGSTSQCRTVDHVLLDTGSYGLRLAASALNQLVLPPVTRGDGTAIAECAQFVDGYSWGSVRQADVRIAGEIARGISIHVLGDAGVPAVPAAARPRARSTASGPTGSWASAS